jgi:tyrosyl-tRNA synthetase
MDIDRLRQGIPAFKMFHEVGLAKSGGESRRLIQQGGGYINDNRLTSFDYLVTDKDIDDQEIVLRAGKKNYFKIKIKK